MASTARGQITITDLNDAKTLFMYLGASKPVTQVFTEGTPDTDWSKSPYQIITPYLYAGGDRIKPSSIEWKLNGAVVASSNTNYGATVQSNTTYLSTLRINKNLQEETLQVEATAKYTDPDSQLQVTASARIDLQRLENAGQLVRAVIEVDDTETGAGVFHNGEPASIKLTAKLMRGNDDDVTDVSYAWSNSLGSITASVANKYTLSTDKKTLTVLKDGVDGMETFFCTIKDTDSKSTTYNKSYTASQKIVDMSDPYHLEIYASTDKLVNGQGTSKLTAIVTQDGKPVAASGYTWSKLKEDGTADDKWTPQEDGQTTTGQTLVVGKSDIDRKATFVCTATIG